MKKINFNNISAGFNNLSYIYEEIVLADDLKVDESFICLLGSNIKSLPRGLEAASINIGCTLISKLPEDLIVGEVIADHTAISSISSETIRGIKRLVISSTLVTELPDETCLDYLDISNTLISNIPEGMVQRYKLPSGNVVNNLGSLRASGCRLLTTLPNFWSSGLLDISNTMISELPEGLSHVVGDLILSGSLVTKLPEDLVVEGDLDISNTLITELPKNLVVKGSIIARSSAIEKIPAGIVIGGDLILSHSAISKLPDNMWVKGGMDITFTRIKSIPQNIRVDGVVNIGYSSVEVSWVNDNLNIDKTNSLYGEFLGYEDD